MRSDILSWKHFKGGSVADPYLDLFKIAPVSDEEFRYLVNNSSENVARHERSHYNPLRECLNSIHYKSKYLERSLTEIDNEFINGARVNIREFLARIKKAPMSKETYRQLVYSNNTTAEFDENKPNNKIDKYNEVRKVANVLHGQDKFISQESLESNIYSAKIIADDLEEAIKKSRYDSPGVRKERLKNSTKTPEKIYVTSVGYRRNADVIIEALDRAKGVCECCHSKAPFVRKKDNSPYLEVHHKVMLSKGGEDTLENAIVLCPNCHREMHFGIKYC